jgi:hypothetical protein
LVLGGGDRRVDAAPVDAIGGESDHSTMSHSICCAIATAAASAATRRIQPPAPRAPATRPEPPAENLLLGLDMQPRAWLAANNSSGMPSINRVKVFSNLLAHSGPQNEYKPGAT